MHKCAFGDAWAAYEKAKAKERQIRKPADSVVEMLPQQKSLDAIGARVGVSLPIRESWLTESPKLDRCATSTIQFPKRGIVCQLRKFGFQIVLDFRQC